jgi:hypothetical protein
MENERSVGEQGALASVVGHALNNVLAYLYAASSYLEDDDVDAARARSAVEDACRGARALAAALTVLGMTRENLAAVPAHGQVVDDFGLEKTLRATAEVAGAELAGAAELRAPHAATLDPDTIEALALCAATVLRRSAGPSASLRQRMALGHDPATGAPRLSIRFEAWLPSGAPAPRRAGHGPCEAALAHAAALLPPLDAALDADDGGAVVLSVGLRVATARGARDT